MTAADASVDWVILPLMRQYAIPGMAVGIVDGDTTTLRSFGTASTDTHRPVDAKTLFEIGSISKAFLATLTELAVADGRLALTDSVGGDFPSLRGTPIGAVTLEMLGTHTPGGMPLQFADAVTDDAAALAWLRGWEPRFPPGTERTYANPSIGLLGLVTAARLGGSFAALERDRVFRPLGLHDTFLEVPPERRADYALGATTSSRPVRMSPGPLWIEAYGIRTTAADLLRFVRANLGTLSLDPTLAHAILATHTGYARIGRTCCSLPHAASASSCSPIATIRSRPASPPPGGSSPRSRADRSPPSAL